MAPEDLSILPPPHPVPFVADPDRGLAGTAAPPASGLPWTLL